MTRITAEVVNGIHALSDHFNLGLYVSIINRDGDIIACIKSGEVAKASFELSLKKAKTAFEFTQDSDVIYQELVKIGQQSLLCEDYCFLAGGLYFHPTQDHHYAIGVSTNNPHLDKEIALNISSLL